MALKRGAAFLYAVISIGVIAFQIALAAGVPWGAYAMGGAFPGQFPPKVRLAALAQAILLGLLAAVVLSRAGLVLPQWSQASVWLTWVIVAFAVISVVLNAITPSAGERRLWLPVTLVLLASSLTVALTGVLTGA